METPGPLLTTILIVEDDHDTRVSLRQTLEGEGYYVFSAANGSQAIELLRRVKPPSLILIDILMPVMNGEELIGHLSTDPVLRLVPAIVVSAFPEDAKRLVASAFVEKPINLKLLLKLIDEYLPRHSSNSLGRQLRQDSLTATH
jgi:CheY-like chemotaxis protein